MSSMSTSTDAFFALTWNAFFGSIPLMMALFPNGSENDHEDAVAGGALSFLARHEDADGVPRAVCRRRVGELIVRVEWVTSAARANDTGRRRDAARTKPEILRIKSTPFKKLHSKLPESDRFKRHKWLELQVSARRIKRDRGR